jgi:hypothetical protein
VEPTAPVDAYGASVNGLSGTPVGAGMTLAWNDDMIYAYAVDTITAIGTIDGANATKGGDDGSGDWSEYRILTGCGGKTVSARFTGSGGFNVVSAAFRASGATQVGAGGPPFDSRYRFRGSVLSSGTSTLGTKRNAWPDDACDFGQRDSIDDNLGRLA